MASHGNPKKKDFKIDMNGEYELIASYKISSYLYSKNVINWIPRKNIENYDKIFGNNFKMLIRAGYSECRTKIY